LLLPTLADHKLDPVGARRVEIAEELCRRRLIAVNLEFASLERLLDVGFAEKDAVQQMRASRPDAKGPLSRPLRQSFSTREPQ
jgi:hypothetical protein